MSNVMPDQKDDVAKSMAKDPETWAELYLEQKAFIEELKSMVDDYRGRLALYVKHPDEVEH